MFPMFSVKRKTHIRSVEVIFADSLNTWRALWTQWLFDNGN